MLQFHSTNLRTMIFRAFYLNAYTHVYFCSDAVTSEETIALDLGNSNSSFGESDLLSSAMAAMSDSPSNSPTLRDTPEKEKKQSSLTPPPSKKGLPGKPKSHE